MLILWLNLQEKLIYPLKTNQVIQLSVKESIYKSLCKENIIVNSIDCISVDCELGNVNNIKVLNNIVNINTNYFNYSIYGVPFIISISKFEKTASIRTNK